MNRTIKSSSGSFGISVLGRVFSDSSNDVRSRIIGIYAVLVLFNLIVWALALISFNASLTTLGLAVTAYTFGLRHSVDADHISAIDNVTRKLMQENKRPVAVGFFFSLGHSTVVILMCFLVALGTDFVKTHFPEFQEVGGILGMSLSAAFLLLIAGINFVIFLEVYKTFCKV